MLLKNFNPLVGPHQIKRCFFSKDTVKWKGEYSMGEKVCKHISDKGFVSITYKISYNSIKKKTDILINNGQKI